MWLIQQLKKEWPVIRGAPVSFGIALLAVAVVAWLALDWRYSGQLENERSKQELLKARVQDYERNLDVADPNEALEKMNELEERITNLSKPTLDLLDISVTKDDAGLYTMTKLITIHAPYTPPGVYLEVRSKGIQRLRIKPMSDYQYSSYGPQRKSANVISDYIN